MDIFRRRLLCSAPGQNRRASAGANRPEEVTTTAVVAGTGLIPLVTLFYRNPLLHIGEFRNRRQSMGVLTTLALHNLATAGP